MIKPGEFSAKPVLAVHIDAANGDEKRLGTALARDASRDFKPIHARHVEIENDGIGSELSDFTDHVGTCRYAVYIVADMPQYPYQNCDGVPIIIRNNDAQRTLHFTPEFGARLPVARAISTKASVTSRPEKDGPDEF
jgi:hypothetical protein